jgi:hypothetical protein
VACFARAPGSGAVIRGNRLGLSGVVRVMTPLRAMAGPGGRALGAVALALVATCLVGGVPPAAGQEPDADGSGDGSEDTAEVTSQGVTLRAEAGIGGFVAPGRPFPISVTVTTDRLVEGRLEVVVPDLLGGSQVIERAVEVSGGSTARFTLLVPTALDGPGEATVRLADAGVEATTSVGWQVDLGQELVGVLPEAAGAPGSLPGAVPLVVDAGIARLVAVEPDLLDAGTLALEPLDQVVATPGELGSLPEGPREALFTWVNGGGQLVLAGEAAGPGLDGITDGVLPAEWRPVAGGAQRAGLGQVRAVGEVWQRSLAPSPTRSAFEEEILASDLGVFDQTMVGRLGRDAGFDLPEPRRLGWLLTVYVALMGPVAFVVVRRLRRREVAWVGLPALAVISTGLVFATGSSLRNTAEVAQVTVYEVGPAGAVASTWSLVPSSHGGEVGVELPEGWTGGAAVGELGGGIAFDDDFSVGASGGGGPVRVSTSGAESRLVQDVGPGGFALLEARGPAAGMAGGLEVTAASSADGQITGTVRNTLDVTLHEVAAFTGRARAVEIGTVAPGETVDFRVDDATRFAWGERPEPLVWPLEGNEFASEVLVGGAAGGEVVVQRGVGADGMVVRGEVQGGGEGDGDRDRRSPVALPAWDQTLQRNGTNYRASGQVVVAGWTDELPAPISTTRGRAQRSATAVVARATASPTGDRLTDTASVKSIVRGPSTQVPPADPEVQTRGGITFVQSFDLPDRVGGRPVDTQRLVINPANLFLSFEFWTPQGWVPVEVPEVGQEERVVPPEAVVGGAVYMRITSPTDAVPGPGRDLVIYEREAAPQ